MEGIYRVFIRYAVISLKFVIFIKYDVISLKFVIFCQNLYNKSAKE